MVPACRGGEGDAAEAQNGVEQIGNAEIDEVGQHDHGHAADGVHEDDGDDVAGPVFDHAEQAEDQAQDAGEEQPAECQQQRLAHGRQQQAAVGGDDLDQGRNSPFRNEWGNTKKRGRLRQQASPRAIEFVRDLFKSVAGGGHVPTPATPPGKFGPKLCARRPRRVRGFGSNFVEEESKGGNRSVRHRRARLFPSLIEA